MTVQRSAVEAFSTTTRRAAAAVEQPPIYAIKTVLNKLLSMVYFTKRRTKDCT